MLKSNLEIIQSTYEGSASSNAKHLAEALSEKIEWTEAKGFPYGGTYVGTEAIMENVFSRLGSEWDDYKASVNTYLQEFIKKRENCLRQNLFIYGSLKMEKS